jgi:hypothetical protein
MRRSMLKTSARCSNAAHGRVRLAGGTLIGTLRVPMGTRSLTSTRPLRETRSAGLVTASINAPGRDMITIRKEIVRNGLYSAGYD